MKKLLIYKDDQDFVIERVNQFNHSFQRKFISEQGLIEGLQSYELVMDEYELEVAEDLWALVVGAVNGLDEAGQKENLNGNRCGICNHDVPISETQLLRQESGGTFTSYHIRCESQTKNIKPCEDCGQHRLLCDECKE
ncbi:hypothetical protein CD798_08350 [Bacillaceae bacterium SAOS 7]|nr:hypothetical protein CD798_08350 [Bacillaceae bacterium SAOS 7]